MSTEKKILVVFGATGAQGGSVIQSLLSIPNSPYQIRAITRNPTSPRALALSSLGITLAAADLNDAASLTSVLTGAHAVFLVTDFWADISAPTQEIEQGRRAIDVLAAIPTLEHLIWSSLPSIKDASGGKYSAVVHFDGKTEVTEYIKGRHEKLWAKTTELWIAPYYQIWISNRVVFGPKKVIDDGREVFVLSSHAHGSVKVPMVDVKETGLVVSAILAKGQDLYTKTVSMIGCDSSSQAENLAMWGKYLDRDVLFNYISQQTTEEYLKNLGMPEYLVRDLVELPLALEEFEGRLYRKKGIVLANEVRAGRKLRGWEEYVKGENWEGFLKD
ncbi:NAD(P)-binding protein [Melanomma pulvis-pyrius CBS 109.77]|uniref:NAD(P)-binding protein n=1 Tax=Melanomma pulvis-pyrius CBS 109.77 TaxID=1314802 RepID=A0A6A6X158_9PLEO|nr:NAD(P)-binding protein [Melanomma pulvis-pyrius CBS 109.77]